MYDHIANKRRWRKENPEKVKAQNFRQKYGISYEKFLYMLKAQKNRCAICRKRETHVNWRTGKVRFLSVDHNHKNNKIRKLLCWRCNLGIGVFRESVPLLQKVIAYLNETKDCDEIS